LWQQNEAALKIPFKMIGREKPNTKYLPSSY